MNQQKMLSAFNVCHRIRKYPKFNVVWNEHAIASYSNQKSDEASGFGLKGKTKPQKLPSDKLKKLDLLVERMPKTTLDIVKRVQMSKPQGYRQMQKLPPLSEMPEKKPKDVVDAARAVSKDLRKKSVSNELLTSIGLNPQALKKAQAKGTM